MAKLFRPAAIFGDHMVLRRDRPAAVFGEAEDGRQITAKMNGRTVYTTARNGRFLLRLPPMPAGGPHSLTLSDGETTVTYGDVLFGEVYLAGGQSNMELALKDAGNGERDAAAADDAQLRYYNVLPCAWHTPETLEAERKVRWKAVAPGACGDMSAVAFHFARKLRSELKVPVGIIDCYWGGTSATCWMTEEALRSTPEGASLLLGYRASIAAKTVAECEMDVRIHDEAMAAWNARVEAARAENPGRSWTEVAALAGPCPWSPPHSPKSAYRPAGLVETMLQRAAPYTLTGFLYYQGEEDTMHPGLYQALLSSLILCWRRLFTDDTLPFLFVQLPMYTETGRGDDRQWAVLREMQEKTFQSVHRVGMAVMIDGGEKDNVHPLDKTTVGERLYWEALRVVYGRGDAPECPRALCVYRVRQELAVLLSMPVLATGEPALFEVAGEGGVFVPAKARIEGRTLYLNADSVAEPTTARYAWVNYGVVNVFGENGLPLAPFRMRE